MIRGRSQRLHQRKQYRSLGIRLVLVVVIPPLLTLFSLWGISRFRTDPVQSQRSRLATDGNAGSRSANVLRSSNVVSQSQASQPVVLASRMDSGKTPETDQDIFESRLPLHGHNSVDDAVFARLIKLGIQPAGLCSDAVFLRRVSIDLTGTLPTASEAEDFLRDDDSRKRAKLIDTLLDRDEYADYWAMKWCDILRVKAEFPINLWPNAAQSYHRWIRTSIHNNMPYDQFVRELLTTSGSNFRSPQVNFYRALQSKDPESIAKTVALTFMASRADNWPKERLAGMSQFFSKVGFKPTGEWKEEIVYFNPRGGEKPGQSLRCFYPTGHAVEVAANVDPRVVFTDWLVHEENPWFARAIANRVWHSLFGRGIVDPPDDVRPGNPATNPELLNHLAEVLVAADYDMKALLRLILRSSAYQLSCIDHSGDPHAAAYFAFYQPRRVDAEVLIDAICQITGTTETYMSIIPEPFTFLPDTQRAIAIPDGSITSSFLEIFGRPPRDTGMVSERNNQLTPGQALHLLNSNHIRNKLKRGTGLVEIDKRTVNTTQKAEQIYLTILSRYPSEEELLVANTWCADEEGTRELAWALMNSDAFLFQH